MAAPAVRPTKKGRVSIEFDTTRLLADEDLLELAHRIKSIRGVKRAFVRTESGHKFIYARINERVKGVLERIDKAARAFWRAHYAQSTPCGRSRKRGYNNRPACVREKQKPLHVALARS